MSLFQRIIAGGVLLAGVAGLLGCEQQNQPTQISQRVNNLAGYANIVPVDIDSDGDEDILLVNNFGSVYRIINDGTGNYSERERISKGVNSAGGSANISVGDITGDGNKDIVLVDRLGITYKMIGDGRGNFSAPEKISGRVNKLAGWANVSLSDIDSDGDLDILLVNRLGIVYKLENNGEGNFSSQKVLNGRVNNFAGYANLGVGNSGDISLVDRLGSVYKVEK